MPILKIPQGEISYHTIPLFPGVKIINKPIAASNLKLLKSILSKSDINFQLHAGTLLGAVREHDFIDHDEDIDLAFLDEDRNKVLSILPILEEAEFKVCRFDRRDLISVIRNGEYIDFYFYKPYNSILRSCSGWLVKSEHLEKSVEYPFKGEKYLIPEKWEEYLIAEYGNSWNIPIKWNNYNIPIYKRILFNLKEYSKDYLPAPLFRILSRRAEQKLISRSLQRLKKNLNL